MPTDTTPTVRLRRSSERTQGERASGARSGPATTRRVDPARTAHRRVSGGRLPDWSELGGKATAPRAGRVEKRLARVRTSRIVAALVLFALVFVAYEAHVYATKDALEAVQAARAENARLHLKLNRLKGEFDAATSPAVVVERAQALGLVEGIGYGATLRLGSDR